MDYPQFLHYAFWGSVAASVGALIAAGILIFKGGRWVGSIEENKRTMAAFFEKMEKEFQVIRGDIKGILAKLPPETITQGVHFI